MFLFGGEALLLDWEKVLVPFRLQGGHRLFVDFWKARKLSILRLLEPENWLALLFALNECVSKIVLSGILWVLVL